MTINFNVTGAERKRLAGTLGRIVGVEPVYMRTPTYAYAVNNYIVSKDGAITFPDDETPEEMSRVIEKLQEEGFTSEEVAKESEADETAGIPAEPEGAVSEEIAPETPDVALSEAVEAQSDEAAERPETAEISPDVAENSAADPAADNPEEANRLSISLPRTSIPDDTLSRLKAIVKNKESLFKRALKIEELPVEVSETEVAFPWFPHEGITGEGEAYAKFVAALVEMAKNQTRILDKPYDGDNDKFAMRIFMVRLGMKGKEFALARKLMMKNLTGNSGWRHGAPPKKSTSDENSSKKSATEEKPAEETSEETPPCQEVAAE